VNTKAVRTADRERYRGAWRKERPYIEAEMVVLEGEDACLAAAGDGVGVGPGSGAGGWPGGTPSEAPRGGTPGSRRHAPGYDRSHLATLDYNLQQVRSHNHAQEKPSAVH